MRWFGSNLWKLHRFWLSILYSHFAAETANFNITDQSPKPNGIRRSPWLRACVCARLCGCILCESNIIYIQLPTSDNNSNCCCWWLNRKQPSNGTRSFSFFVKRKLFERRFFPFSVNFTAEHEIHRQPNGYRRVKLNRKLFPFKNAPNNPLSRYHLFEGDLRETTNCFIWEKPETKNQNLFHFYSHWERWWEVALRQRQFDDSFKNGRISKLSPCSVRDSAAFNIQCEWRCDTLKPAWSENVGGFSSNWKCIWLTAFALRHSTYLLLCAGSQLSIPPTRLTNRK